ncbi:MAG: hypothetical protein [Caudoviricetes sp.]|nr:MAG: hypothetical protein [Caudoviricetes sp.]
MGCGADTEANELLISLTSGDDFVVPDIDLSGPEYQIPGDGTGPGYEPIQPLNEAQLTTRVVGGTGMFDGLMATFSAHLKTEFEKGRITGADYTKAYIALTESALSGAVTYLLGKDQAFWQAMLAQAQAITAKVQLATAKVQMAAVRIEAMNAKAGYGLTKLKLSTESVTYCTAQYNLTNMLPQQLAAVKEQTEAQRAQTLDTRTDGAAVVGVLGKQKALYSQQITSYQRDSEVKAGKLFTDAWITMKTIDEGLLPPAGFQNSSLDQILTALKVNNAIGT